jgi:hypothetical protein
MSTLLADPKAFAHVQMARSVDLLPAMTHDQREYLHIVITMAYIEGRQEGIEVATNLMAKSLGEPA